MRDNVFVLPGCAAPITADPNPAVIAALEKLLEVARSGRLQSFVGTGFTAEGLRCAMWVDLHPDVYQMLGSLAWLQAEYIHRHEDTL